MLGFAWFYSSESGLFKGLRRNPNKKFCSALLFFGGRLPRTVLFGPSDIGSTDSDFWKGFVGFSCFGRRPPQGATPHPALRAMAGSSPATGPSPRKRGEGEQATTAYSRASPRGRRSKRARLSIPPTPRREIGKRAQSTVCLTRSGLVTPQIVAVTRGSRMENCSAAAPGGMP